MKEKKSMYNKEKSIEKKTQELFGFDEKSLQKEMEEAQKEWEEMQTQDPEGASQINRAMDQSFQKLMDRIHQEKIEPMDEDTYRAEQEKLQTWDEDIRDEDQRAEEGPKGDSLKAGIDMTVLPKSKKWKRRTLLLVAVICVFATTMVVMGDRGLEFGVHLEKQGQKNVFVKRNTKPERYKDDLEHAYEMIEQELNIRPIALYYIPEGMTYESIRVADSRATMKFCYKEQNIYLHQIAYKDDVGIVGALTSDCDVKEEIQNIGMDQTIEICENILKDGKKEYVAYIDMDKASYIILGIIEKEEFIKIVEQLYYYK